MALSYNLYQIGFIAYADTNVSYVQDPGLSLASSLPAEQEGYGADAPEQIIDLSGDRSNFDESLKDDYYHDILIIIGGELILASFTDDVTNTQLEVDYRGDRGTPVQSHSAGDTIYQVDPQHRDDVTVNTGLRRIKDITDFAVEDVGQFEEAVEYEKGTFRVSNVSVTVSGINRHTLSDAGDIDKPWVFEVRDSGNSLLFQGILKDDAKFNAGTEKINFTAVSWLEILNRVESLPARVQYEADIKAVTLGDPTGEVTSDITVQFPSSRKFTSNFPSRGDTVAIETNKGEFRKIATKVEQGQEFTNVKIPVDNLFENLVYSSKGKTSSNPIEFGKTETYSDPDAVFGEVEYTEVRFKNLTDELESTLTNLSNPNKYKILLFDNNDNIVDQVDIRKSNVNTANENWPKVFNIASSSNYVTIPDHTYFIIVKNTGSQALQDKVSSLEAGKKVKVLSQEMWGYEGIDDSNDGLPDYFDPQGLMDALFKTQEVTYDGIYDGVLPTLRLGVLPKIMQSNGVVFGRGGPDDVFETIDPRVEFPTAPIEALRMIQQDTGTMLTVNTSTTTNAEGETIPSVQFELLPRQRLLDDANRVQLEDVTDWSENTSEKDVRAVVIEPNNQYGRGGDDQPEYLGIYTEQMDRNFNSPRGDWGSNNVPEGDDVIRIKTNHFPNGRGATYREGDDPVVNDNHLIQIARLYYKQFTEANRKVEFSVGRDNPDVLAKYVSIEEGRVVDDSVLVTQKRHYLEEDHRETSLVGRIGGRAKFGETAPVPDIRVPRAFRADSSDVASILVSGRNSYDGRPGTLSFQWEYKKVSASTWTSGGTGAVLEEDITFTGGRGPVTYDVRLTVTNNNTGASAQETDQFVIKPYNETYDRTPSNEVDYDKQQVTKNGNRYAQINVTPANPELVQTDSNGNPLFEFRAAQGAEIDGSTSWYRVGSGNSPQGSGQVVTDGNGNVTGFFAEVQLDPKHVSNIQTRIKWTETVGYANQGRSHAFDFDSVAEVDASVYNDDSGAVYADVQIDEDTAEFDLEYRKNGAATWTNALSGQSTGIVGYEVVPASNVTDGDSIDVRITPFNFDGAEGKQVVRATFYNRSTGGASQFDGVEINGAGTIDSIQSNEFRFRSTDGSDNAKIDVFGLKVDEINGTSVSEFASQSDVELLAKNIVQTEADIDALDAVTVRRSRELVAGNAIGPLGDLSEDRTVTVQEEDLAGTFLASDGSGALAVQTTGDLVGDGSGKMQIGQSVVQTREIDESIAPTWTGVHTHAADIDVQSQQVRFDDGVLQGDGNGALEVLKADESNQGTLRVDQIVAHTVTVVDEIDQRNVNDLRVEDQYIVVNNNQSGTPGLDGGLVAERGGLEDAYIEWEEGLDVWGTRLENGSLKPLTLRDTSMTSAGIPYWNQQEERIETAADLTYKEAQSNGFYNGNEVQTTAGVGHPDYTAELEHWYITPGGLGDFRTLLADELRVEAFIAEVEEALAGSDFLTKSFATLDAAFDVPSSSPVGTQKDLTVQDLDGLGSTPVFGNDTSQQDDTLRLRIIDRSGGGLTVADIWLRCFAGSYTDNGDGTQTWTVEILEAGDAGIGAGLTAPEGSVVLDYGVPGDFLIERSVLNRDSGDIAPYDRMLSWKDNDGDRIPDDYEVLNLRGRLDGLSKAYASGFGTYTETARFTSDIIVGDIEAGAAGDQTGSYLRFSDSDGLEVVYGDGFGGTSDGRLSSAVLQLEDDVRLLAQEIVQEQESRAGLEITASETEAEVRAQAEIIGDNFSSNATISAFADETKSRFESSVQYTKNGEVEGEAKINLEAGPNGSSAVLAAEDVRISGNTTFVGSPVTDGVLANDYTSLGDESQTFRQPSPAPTKSDAKGRELQTGDIWIDTSDGNNPHVYDGPNNQWEAAYTNIDGGNITTGTISLNRIDFTVENGKIAAEDLAITASDLTISGSSKSDVQNAVLQLEDDVRLLAENLTQEQEARAGLELTASETEARFEADVKFAGNTAAITLLANDDESSARIAGDSIILDGQVDITEDLDISTGGISSFSIGSKRIERYNTNDNIDTAIGKDLQDVDGANRALFGEYLGASAMKVVGSGGKNTDYVLANATTAGTLFEVKSGGDSIIRVEDSGAADPTTFIDKLNLQDLTIAGTLTMGSNGKITNQGGDYTLDQNGLQLEYGDYAANELSFFRTGTKHASVSLFSGFYGETLQFTTVNAAGISIKSDAGVTIQSSYGNSIDISAGNGKTRFGGKDEVQIDTDYDDNGGTFQSHMALVFDANYNIYPTVYTEHPKPNGGQGIVYLYDAGGGDLELFAATTNQGNGSYNRNKLAG